MAKKKKIKDKSGVKVTSSKAKGSKSKSKKSKQNQESFISKFIRGFNEKRTIYLYCIGFIVLVGFFSFVQSTDWFKEAIKPILYVYASISSVVLNLFGQGTSATAETVSSERFSVNIKQGCDAIAPMLMFMSAILLYPIRNKWKWPGIGIGLVILFILNIIRIITLYLSGVYGNMAFFDFMHIEFWQVLYIILTVILWFYWIKWANKKESASS